VGIVEKAGLTDAILCGHSAAGMVITGVANLVPGRIRALVYLDAVIPEAGQSLLDAAGEPLSSALRQRAADRGEGWRVPASYYSAATFGVTDPVDVEWVETKLTDHPLAAFADPIEVITGLSKVPNKVYVRCTGHTNRPYLDRALLWAEARPDWTVFRWPSAHDVMVTEPSRVSDLLKSLAEGWVAGQESPSPTPGKTAPP
jgi:pimeloyl-ACP methyl ester carboxylesterase